MSQGTNTTFWYVDYSDSVDPFLLYLVELLELSEPPMVNSISYGGPEDVRSYELLLYFLTYLICSLLVSIVCIIYI